ncbi:hypothetical protein BT69DRAFT_1243769 [Atractiella rhizophila]|nr:hypothetical protein BT69DRAFT_1243769 [Atractiella rhizophila]
MSQPSRPSTPTLLQLVTSPFTALSLSAADDSHPKGTAASASSAVSPATLLLIAKSASISDTLKLQSLGDILRRSASTGNASIVEVLVSTRPGGSRRNSRYTSMNPASRPPTPGYEGYEVVRDYLDVREEKDPETGSTPLILATAFGQGDCVRVLVESGADVGGRDAAGWTALHWAVQTNNLPLASYLLNHRADPTVRSIKGLTPFDVARKDDEGDDIREVLRAAEEAREDNAEREEDEGSVDGKTKSGDSMSIRSSRSSVSLLYSGTRRAEEEAKEKQREKQRRLEMAEESARWLGVDLGVLTMSGGGGFEGDNIQAIWGNGGGLGGGGDGTSGIVPPSAKVRTSEYQWHDDEDPHWDDETADHANNFVWDRCLPDQMLVFSLDDLDPIFDLIISDMKPLRSRTQRPVPANVILLSARFAHYYGSTEMLDELLLGAIERIEGAVHAHADDMSNSAFWLSNCLLLLYYLRKEPNLLLSTSEYQIHLSDLINEIFVFVVRDAERRIDKLLDEAMLEYEALPGFEDVRFEGEWNMLKKLTARAKRDSKNTPSAFNAPGSPKRSSKDPRSRQNSSMPGNGLSDPMQETDRYSPRTITSLLSSTLFILQCYEIHPSVVVQAFSQVFYWLACEIFNRILMKKKFLCRSKAIQIRLNASVLEDWARVNRMPTKLVTVHFTPLNQLLQWLQCLSGETSIDGLIGTIHNLRSLNPFQLRKAVRDYRYEVDETRMPEECNQYLLQVQKQWERQRLESKMHAEREGKLGDDSDAKSDTSDVEKMIDDVFSSPASYARYSPPGGVECLGELLDSRYMLPFALPSSAEMLLSFGSGEHFGPFAHNNSSWNSRPTTPVRRPFAAAYAAPPQGIEAEQGLQPGVGGGYDGLRPASAAGSATSDEADRLPPKFIPILPDGFLEKLDMKKSLASSSVSRATTVKGRRSLNTTGAGELSPIDAEHVGGGWMNVTDYSNEDETTVFSNGKEDTMGPEVPAKDHA